MTIGIYFNKQALLFPILPIMKKIFSIIATFLAIKSVSYGQTMNVVPPSPATATLQRFVDYPVNLSSGLVDISLPLYTIALKDYSFPITINFHASGRRATEDYSPLGVGWALMGSGFISREIRGRPDEDAPQMDVSAETISENDDAQTDHSYDRLLGADASVNYGDDPVIGHIEDAEHDIYTYSVNGISGKFIIDKGTVYPLTYTPYTITGSPTGSFTITDDKGIRYEFGNAKEGDVNYIEEIISPPETGHITGWYLNSIVLPSGEVIKFNYGVINNGLPNSPITSRYDQTWRVDYGITGDINTYVFDPPNPDVQYYDLNIEGPHASYSSTTTSYLVTYLTSIDFPEGVVTFNYNQSDMSLSSCIVKNVNQKTIRNATFNYKTAYGTSGRTLYNNNSLALNSLTFNDVNGQPVEVYSFDYYNGNLATSDPLQFLAQADWWGYCNNTPNSYQPPYDPYADPELSGNTAVCNNCRSASLTEEIGMLKSIHFPTGGKTTFVYEPNIYANENDPTMPTSGPGLRIQKVITDDSLGNRITSLYKYGENENGIGHIARQPNPVDFKQSLNYYSTYSHAYAGNYTVNTFFSHPVPGMQAAYVQPIYYTDVSVYKQDQDGNNLGRTRYTFTTPQYTNDYTAPLSFYYEDWTDSKPESIDIQKYNNQSETYETIDYTQNLYNIFKNFSLPGIRFERAGYVIQSDADAATVERELAYGIYGGIKKVFYNYKDFSSQSAVEKLVQTQHSVHDDLGNIITTITNYSYGDTITMAPTEIATTTSKNDSLITQTQYYDYSPSLPLEISVFRKNTDNSNNRVVKSKFISYTNYFPTSIYNLETAAPLTTFHQATYSSGTYVRDSHYPTTADQAISYDGDYNIQQITERGGDNTCYLWSYNGQYPVAQIKHASWETIQSILGSAAITAMSHSNPDDATLNNFLAPLRSNSILANAQIMTYTYEPLIGMTSETDPKGETTYFQYDTFNRLSEIKDENGKIVKLFSYVYTGQVPNGSLGDIYARIEYTNGTTSYREEGESIYSTGTADLEVHFYSDAACTQSVSIPSGMYVSFNEYASYYDGTSDSYLNTYWVPGNVSSYVLATGVTTYEDDNIVDPNTGIGTDEYSSYDYEITTQSGSNYIPEASY